MKTEKEYWFVNQWAESNGLDIGYRLEVKPKLGRIPLPRKTGGPQTSKKGKKGYDRKVERAKKWQSDKV